MTFKVYKSSAGSGKTFTLVKEYLDIALSSDNTSNYKAIMAVTFTNKAANEMKERVIKYLRAISANEYSDGGEKLIQHQLLESLNIKEGKLQERASKTLKSILHNYSDFNISTIDKFILKIIRSFSLDFQIPFNFDVEMDTESILNNAVENVIAEAGENKELTDFLLRYVSEQAEDDENWNVTSALASIAKKTLNDESTKFITSLKDFSFQDFLKSKKKCESEINLYESKISSYIQQGQKAIESNNIKASDLIGLSRGYIYKYFHPVKDDALFTLATDKAIADFEKDTWAHKNCDSGTAQVIAEIQNQLYGCFTGAEQIKTTELEKINSLQLVSKHLFQLALINEIEKQVQALKEEKNFIHIAEFNQKVADIVVQQPIPFIYERIGEKFSNYLVDEFQDTSELQWQNLMPLIENSLAYGNFNLVVGDVKQAIYRWRGGNVDQFQHIDDASIHEVPLVRERAERIASYLVNEQLTTNYRSFPEVINFNNLFFKVLLDKLSYDFKKSYYSDYHQEIGTSNKGGYIEILVHEKSEELTATEYFLEQCYNTVIDVTQRGKQFKDITVLARKNKHLEQIGSYLSSKGIPILSSVSLSLGKSQEIQFIMAVFKFVNNPNDYVAMVKIIEFLTDNEDIVAVQRTVFEKRSDSSIKLRSYLKDTLKVQVPDIHNVGLYDAIENIIRTFDLDKNNPFVQKLLDIANAKQEENSLDFIEWWELKQNKTYISSPESINAVKLMTIHKAKGLEFPVVIYPFANPPSQGQQENLLWANTTKLDIDLPYSIVKKNKKMQESLLEDEFDKESKKEMLDELNTTYVALTRAVEELYILITEPAKNFASKEVVDKSNEFFYPVLEELEQDENKYFLGTKINYQVNKEEHVNKNEIHVIANKGWKDKIKLSYGAPSIWNVPLTSEDDFDLLDPRRFGNLIHTILSKLDFEHNLDQVLEFMTHNGFVLKKDSENIKSQINDILALPLLQMLWNEGEHIIEKDFINKNGVVFRPDRIVLLSNECYLIDFKTGAKHKKHQKQIEQYAMVLQDLKYKNIKAFLIYTDPIESVEVVL